MTDYEREEEGGSWELLLLTKALELVIIWRRKAMRSNDRLGALAARLKDWRDKGMVATPDELLAILEAKDGS